MRKPAQAWWIAAALAVLVIILLIGFDGPLWQLSVPSSIPPELRPGVARLRSWRGSTRGDAAIDLSLHGASAAPAAPTLIEHFDDTGWAEGWSQGFSKMFSFHGGPAFVSVECMKAVIAIGPPAVPDLIAALRSPRERVRMAAADILGDTGDPRAVPPLHAAQASDSSPSVRNIALRALARLRDRSALDLLERQLHDPDMWRRLDAATVLGSCRCAEVVSPLTEALQDPAPQVAAAASAALQAIARTKEALPR